jgi:glycosyltransferase involved in cell wall biosynthesis
MPLSLSICIPTFNRATFLHECLSRLEQQQQHFREVVISDNASPDATAAVVEEFRPRFPRLTYFRHRENRGPLPNFHASLSLATSDLLFILSDDDALLPDSIDRAVALLEADPECVAVFGGYERSRDALLTIFSTAVPRVTGRFTLADIGAVAQTANTLTIPVIRREVFQRHCFFDNTTFGTLRLIAQLVQHGAIRIVDDPLYRHAEATPNSNELRVSEPWYLEFLRADWELFVGMLGDDDFNFTAQLTAGGIVPVYLLAHEVERNYNRPLNERSFLIRYFAYAGGLDRAGTAKSIADWEAKRLIAATLERLAERLSLCAGLARVVIEQGRLNIGGMWEVLAPRFPGIDAVRLDETAFAAFGPGAGDFRLAETWSSLERCVAELGGNELAVTDMISSLRLPGSRRIPLLHGPEGSVHFSMDR